jgi:alcohol dehydrogenase (cytochrome c)
MVSLSRFSVAALFAGLAIVLAPEAESSNRDRWPVPNLSRASTRAAVGSPINASNVSRLRVLWRFRFTQAVASYPVKAPETIRGVVATPIVAGGTIYIEDATSAVYAINRATGALRWKHPFRAANFGRNGLSYSSGSVYGATDTTVFALSSTTGRLIWQQRLVTPLEQYVDIAPLIANNLVYVSTVGYPPGGRGAVYALNAHSGTVRWRFSTIRDPWGDPASAGGGGAWYTPSVDAEGNVYWGVANPYPIGGTREKPNGGAYPGPALYTDSLIVLDGQTGRLLWHDQVTPHDVRDYDFQLPPILAAIPTGGTLRNVVFGAGKAGIVIAWDEHTHKRIWETLVGRHLNDTGPLPKRTVKVCPGIYGGVMTPMAYAGTTLFVPVVDLCAYGSAYGFEAIGALDPVKGTGEFLALNAANGRVTWKRRLPQPDFGCATLASGVVFTSTVDGRIYGLDATSGATLWQARAPAGINGCPALSGNMLIVPAGSGTTRMRNPIYEMITYALPPAPFVQSP